MKSRNKHISYFYFITVLLLILSTGRTEATDVSGSISGTWKKSDSPYIVTGDITVLDLTIEPGVEVIFNGDYKFRITGSFNASGTKSDSIHFYPAELNPDDYEGLFFESAAQPGILDYCVITGANTYGIRFENNQATVSNSRISDISGNGIESDGCNLHLERSIVSGVTANAVDLISGSKARIYNTRLINNRLGLNQSSSRAELHNTLIAHNNDGGITLLSNSDTLDFINTTIAANTAGPGIVHVAGVTITGMNSIIYDNNSSVLGGIASVTISYSGIQGPYSGAGSENLIDTDPQFEDQIDFKLNQNSPMVDKGNPSSEYNDRCFPPSLRTVLNDMGAYGGPGACLWLDPVEIFPAEINFNTITVGDSGQDTLKIHNNRDSSLSIDSLFLTGTDSLDFTYSNITASVEPFDSSEVRVIFTPQIQRVYTATLNLRIDGYLVQVPLTGNGAFPNITTTPSRLDFDEVRVGEHIALPFNIVNLAPGTLRVSEITFTDSSFSSEGTSFPITIAEFSRDTIDIVFRPDSNIAYLDSLYISSNDPDQPLLGIRLTGTGKAPNVSASVSELSFNRVMVDSAKTELISFENTGNDTLILTGFDLTADNGFFTIETFISDTVLLPGESSENLSVRFLPDSAVSYSDTLIITSNSPFHNPLKIPLSGSGVQPRIDVDEPLFFEEVIIDQIDSLILSIHNSGDTTLTIDSVRISSGRPFFSVTNPGQISIPADSSSDTLMVFFKPDAEGNVAGALEIYSNDPDNRIKTINLEGNGVRPELELDPKDILAFGQVAQKDSASRSVGMKNSGSGTLIIDTVYVTGPDSNLFSLPDYSGPITIPESDTSGIEFKILFKPGTTGTKSALLNFRTNNPDSGNTMIELTGEGTQPVLSLSAESVDFDTVYISDTADSQMVISNSGNGQLIISELKISGPDSALFSVMHPSLPDTLPADSLANLTIMFTPDSLSAGPKSALLRITSNDTTLEVALTGISESPVKLEAQPDQLAFEPVYVGQDSARQITIFNHGIRELILINMMFSGHDDSGFSISGFNENQSIPSGASRQYDIIFKPEQPGDISDTLVITSNDPLNNLKKIPVSGTANADTFPVVFEFTARPDTIEFGSESEIKVNIAKDGPAISKVIMHMRPGGAVNFSQMPLTQSGPGTWSAQIPDSSAGIRGLEYYISAANGGMTAFSPDSGAQNPFRSIVTNITASFPQQTQAGKYQMISLPVTTGAQTLNDLFGDDLGNYDDTAYRLFEWSARESRYTELTSMDRKLEPGKALWLITKDSKQLNFSGAQSVDASQPFVIPLQPGWNMFGTPFAFEIDETDIDKSALAGNMIYHYSPGGWNEESPESSPNLMPYYGYAVKALSATDLIIPNRESIIIQTKPKTDPNAWQIKLSAHRDQATDHFNLAGVRTGATNNVDIIDYPEPPPIGDYVSLYFTCEDERLTGDFRKANEQGYIFDFTVQASFTGMTTIDVMPENLPENYTWRIVSPQTGLSYDQESMTTSASSQEYKLIVGETDFVEEVSSGYRTRPAVYELAQNYPNPFNPETKIRFALPAAGQINVAIYDITGRKIFTIAENEQREAGYYEYTWQGLNDSGKKVASGIYFLYLRAPGFSKAIKMILQR